MKTCTRCKQTKELKEFHKHKNSPDGLQTRCKPCASEIAKLKREKEIETRSYESYLEKAKQQFPKTYGCYKYNKATKGSQLKTPKILKDDKKKCREAYKRDVTASVIKARTL